MKELRAAELELYKLLRKESYPQEYKEYKDYKNSYTNLMLQLGLYMEHGVIKCRGRLQLATFQDMLKYHILLSGKHHVTRLNSKMSCVKSSFWYEPHSQLYATEMVDPKNAASR